LKHQERTGIFQIKECGGGDGIGSGNREMDEGKSSGQKSKGEIGAFFQLGDLGKHGGLIGFEHA
jgi:hypothetical protein